MQIKGYTITKLIYRGPGYHLFRAIREEDNRTVVIKMSAAEYPQQQYTDRLYNHYDILKDCCSPGIIGVYDILKHHNRTVLILEDMCGENLRQSAFREKIDTHTFLKGAIKISRALEQVHDLGIIHKDIRPENIIVCGLFDVVKITGFSFSARTGSQQQRLIGSELPEGSLSYISPEQTGRMNRPVDYRTDFYSLGITLYEMATGRLPFTADDPLGIVHQHIAAPPPHLDRLKAGLGEQISRIILKLLSKNAEDRYRSAGGLKKDLETCLAHLEKSGGVPLFTLAEADYSAKFQLSGKLYGRDREWKIILEAYKKAAEGNCRLLLVTGPSGIGKSALIRELYKPNLEYRGFFISGKYEGFKNNIPYSAFIRAFDQLMRILLTKSDRELSEWREAIEKALGNNGAVITDIIPALKLIIGEQEKVPALLPVENQNRFRFFFQRFAEVFAGKGHPLTIFLDDLQWADLASLDLLKNLITGTQAESLLVIGAYRDNEVHGAHPLVLTLDRIEKDRVEIETVSLAPLTREDINQLISDSLEQPRQKMEMLTELVYRKTEGNPFFIDRFLEDLYTRKMLTFEYAKGWSYDVAKIEALQVTSNVVELLTYKIRGLSERTVDILKTASCIGNRFTIQNLITICGISRDLLNPLLANAAAEGFIITAGDTCIFSHDKVQEAVYSLIPGGLRKTTHYKVGRLLYQYASRHELDKYIFDIADQLNEAKELIISEEERIELAEVNLAAGKKAKEGAAYQIALQYLREGIELTEKVWWTTHYRLMIALYIQGAEAAYLAADFELMEQLISRALEHNAALLDRVKIYEIKINAHAARSNHVEAVAAGKVILKELGVNIPEKAGRVRFFTELIKTRIRLGIKRVEELQKLPPMTDPVKLAAMKILMSISSSVYYSASNLVPVIGFIMCRLTIAYGNSPYSAFAYAAYGLILCGFFHDMEKGYRFGELALHIISYFNADYLRAKVYLLNNSFINHWKSHYKHLMPAFLEGYTKGLESGDLEYAGFCSQGYFQIYALTGGSRHDMLSESAKHLKTVEQLRQIRSITNIKESCQFSANLAGNNSMMRTMLKGEYIDQEKMIPLLEEINSYTDLSILYVYNLILCYLFGDYPQALENARKAQKHIDALKAMVFIPVYTFYHSLTLLAQYREQPKLKQVVFMNRVKKNQRLLKKWARLCPVNYLHKYYLVEAERARVQGRKLKAEGFYEKAIALAAEHDYANEQAIAYERAAVFYIEQDKPSFARLYLQKSRYLYKRWGALEKERELNEKYLDLLRHKPDEQETLTDVQNNITPAGFDITTILKASSTLSGEIHFNKLVKKLLRIVVENAGAGRGVLILEEGGRYYIEAETLVDQPETALPGPAYLTEYRDIPHHLLRYVLNSREPYVTGQARTDTICGQDRYIKEKKVRSLLCFPIIHHSKLMALIYLENRLTTNAFTPASLKILESLSSQIGISLENARLYRELSDKERIKSELEIARKIQTAIVPPAPEDDDFEIAVCMLPAVEVGGDYYDVLYDSEKNLWLAIGDVTGHGVTPGLIMMMAQSSFGTMLHNFPDLTPSRVITKVNRLLNYNIKQRLGEDHFMTMTFLKHIGSGRFLHSGAHIPIMIYRKETDSCELIETKGIFLGWVPDISKSAYDLEFQLNSGDIMLLYTDGIIEARNKLNKSMLEVGGLQNILIEYASLDIATLRDSILQDTLDWCGGKPADDITMIVVRKK